MLINGSNFCPKDSTNCPSSYETCELADGKPCPPCSRAISLDVLTTQAKRVLCDLLSEKRNLHAEINHSHDHITNRLPPEVSSSIFLHSLADYRTLDPEHDQRKLRTIPLVLGAVCQTWRNIVQASPDLWTHLSIQITGSDSTATTLDMAHQWISRAGQLPLALRIHSPMNSPPIISRGSVMRFHVTEFIKRYLLRCRRLELECSIVLVPCFSGSAPLLEVLKIVSNDRGHYLTTSIHLHSMKAGARISIIGYRPNWLNIPWENVAIFEGDSNSEESLEVIEKSSRLSECNIIGFQSVNGYMVAPRGRTVTHNMITSLSLTSHRYPTVSLLEILTLPALTHLKVCDLLPGSLLRLIQRSSCKLASLFLENVLVLEEESELIEVLRATPDLRELHLVADNRCVYTLFDWLGTSAVNGDNPQDNFLSNLSTLRIRFSAETGFFWELITGVFGTFDDIQNTKRRPITELGVAYDWHIGHARPPFISPVSPDIPSYHLSRTVMQRLLTIAQAGVHVDLYDIHTGTDMLRTAMEYHDIEIPEGYSTKIGGRHVLQSHNLQMRRINEFEFNSDYDLAEESDSDSEDDPEDDSASDSDASDRTYDYSRGLPANVTGETSDLVGDDAESDLENDVADRPESVH